MLEVRQCWPEGWLRRQQDYRSVRGSASLDLRFIVSVENVIELIVQDPLRWRQLDEDVRRCLTRVFPYAAFQ